MAKTVTATAVKRIITKGLTGWEAGKLVLQDLIDSVADFAAAVPEAHTGLCKQGIDQIHRLHTGGKLPAVYHEEDAKEVEPLLGKWEKEGLSYEEVTGLLDMLYVTGRRLYGCEELPEWKRFIDQYQRHWLAHADERFGHAYAVLEDARSENWSRLKITALEYPDGFVFKDLLK